MYVCNVIMDYNILLFLQAQDMGSLQASYKVMAEPKRTAQMAYLWNAGRGNGPQMKAPRREYAGMYEITRNCIVYYINAHVFCNVSSAPPISPGFAFGGVDCSIEELDNMQMQNKRPPPNPPNRVPLYARQGVIQKQGQPQTQVS